MKIRRLKPGEAPPDDGTPYLFAHQAEFYEAIDPIVMAVMGRGAGKSQMASFVCAKHLKEGFSGLLIGPTFEDCDVILSYLIDILEQTKTRYKWHKSKHYVKLLRNGAILYYRTAETEKGIRGKTNLNFLVMDEAALADKNIYDVAIACLRGSQVKWTRKYIVTTPKGRGNWVYDLSLSDDCRLIRGTTKDNTALDSSFYESLKAAYSNEFFEQEVNGGWIDLTACNLYDDWEFDSLNSYAGPGAGEVVVGIDVAVGGDNSSSCVIRGNEMVSLLARKTTTDVQSLISMVRESLGGLQPNYIVIDATGVGAFAPAEFKREWPTATVIPVNFGDKAWKPGYENRRAEIHFDFKARLKSKCIYFGPSIHAESRIELQRQMRASEYMIGNKSAFKLIPKKEIKAKSGRSPDDLDSVALACSVDAVAIKMMSVNSQIQQHNTYSNRR